MSPPEAGVRPLWRAMRSGWQGRLPARYGHAYPEEFTKLVASNLRPGMRILDVGGGRHPTIPFSERPENTHYVGLDVSAEELRRAPPNSYSEFEVSDIAERVGRFENQFDLIVCYQVLEHVRPLDRAFENMRSYLHPDGRVLAVFSGRFSIFGLVNLLVPRPIVLWGGKILLGRDPTSVFPAVYHRCWYSALERLLTGFSEREITPFYEAAAYLRFSRFLQGLFLAYEEWTWLKKHRNLASHYLVNAVA